MIQIFFKNEKGLTSIKNCNTHIEAEMEIKNCCTSKIKAEAVNDSLITVGESCLTDNGWNWWYINY